MLQYVSDKFYPPFSAGTNNFFYITIGTVIFVNSKYNYRYVLFLIVLLSSSELGMCSN